MKSGRRRLWSFLLAMPATAFFAGAGGLHMSGVTFFAALVGAAPRRTLATLRRPSAALVVMGIAILWTCVSLAWSPNQRPDQVTKLLILTPVFLLFPFQAILLDEAQRRYVRAGAVYAVAAGLIFIALESFLTMPVSLSYKQGVEGLEGDLPYLIERARITLSRGLHVMLLLTGPVLLILWRSGGREARIGAVILLALALFSAAVSTAQTNLLSVLLALVAGGVALRAPRRTLQAMLIAAGVLLVISPLLIAILIWLGGDWLGQAVPFSWAWRLEIWNFVLDRITERPIAGHGLDAARAINATMPMRGYDIDLLPLHSHNAPLHIWLETGLIGAVLWATVLFNMAAAVGRWKLASHVCAGIVYAGTVWLCSVYFGFGIWQEWHHGALAFAIAIALVCGDRPPWPNTAKPPLPGMAEDLR